MKIFRWQISTWKKYPIPMSSGKCKLKQRDTYYKLIRITRIQNTGHTYCWWGYEEAELWFVAIGNEKQYSHFGRVWQFLTILLIALTIWSKNFSPWYLPKKLKTCPHKTLHTNILKVSFIITRTWKQSRCLLLDEWVNCGLFNQRNINVKNKWSLKPGEDMKETEIHNTK